MESNIRVAADTESAIISSLALRSKAYWGYSEEFLDSCRDELTYSAEDVSSSKFEFRVCEAGGRIVGFYALELKPPTKAELGALFVEPDMIGKGIGRRLIEHAKSLGVELGIECIIIQGDPNAEAFYLAAGGIPDGRRESGSIPGRFLPIFRIDLQSRQG